MTEKEIEPHFITMKEAATYLHIPLSQIYVMNKMGQLPSIKMGKRTWRVRKKEFFEMYGIEE